MSRSTPQMRGLAERLIAYETARRKVSETPQPAVFFVCEKLRPPLATLMGDNGFRALLSRALALARSEAAWLQSVQVKADGTLTGLREMHAQLAPEEFFEGKVIMLTQLLGLLVAFIGENLTLRIILEIWPKLTRKNLNLSKRTKK